MEQRLDSIEPLLHREISSRILTAEESVATHRSHVDSVFGIPAHFTTQNVTEHKETLFVSTISVRDLLEIVQRPNLRRIQHPLCTTHKIVVLLTCHWQTRHVGRGLGAHGRIDRDAIVHGHERTHKLFFFGLLSF